MKLLQINLACNWGSTGRIAEDIGNAVISRGGESYIAYGPYASQSSSHMIKVSSDKEIKRHHYMSRLFDMQGLDSQKATILFIEKVKRVKPDIVHLHNIHGSYINYPILFDFLKEYGVPVVWTLHDCWSFTGHCAFFEHNNCFEWRTGCKHCRFKEEYPHSSLFSRSYANFKLKSEKFLQISNRLTLVPVSHWLEKYLHQSYFKGCDIRTIHNGIDIDRFKPHDIERHKLILGVANAWGERKGLYDFYSLREILPKGFEIILVGLTNRQIEALPFGITGITRTQSIEELARLYSSALALVNPTYSDNYPTVNLEAIACGTPVVTYDTGGSQEAVDNETGIVVKQGDVNGLKEAVLRIDSTEGDLFSAEKCRKKAEAMFDKNKVYEEYLAIYQEILLKA